MPLLDCVTAFSMSNHIRVVQGMRLDRKREVEEELRGERLQEEWRREVASQRTRMASDILLNVFIRLEILG